jgi:hypothetical protein
MGDREEYTGEQEAYEQQMVGLERALGVEEKGEDEEECLDVSYHTSKHTRELDKRGIVVGRGSIHRT